MQPFWEEHFGNAASHTHVFGWRAEAAVEDARERIANLISADPREIIFTSGATESNNLALLGVCRASQERSVHLITQVSEHPSVLDPSEVLVREGYARSLLSIDSAGRIDPDDLKQAMQDDTLLVSVMAANNEIGALQPIGAVAELCRERGILFHSDAAQAFGKIDLNGQHLPVDLLSVSGHKIYGPKGVGFLFLRRKNPRIRIQPLQYGGGHERGIRSGTLPVPLIVGLARAAELAVEEGAGENKRIAGLRDRLLEHLRGQLAGVIVHGGLEARLPGNLNLGFAHVPGDALLAALKDVALSSGSACASADPAPSHVLLALGLSRREAHSALRFGIGRFNSEAEIDWVAQRVIDEVRNIRGH